MPLSGAADASNDFKTPSGNIYCQMSTGRYVVPDVACEGRNNGNRRPPGHPDVFPSRAMLK